MLIDLYVPELFDFMGGFDIVKVYRSSLYFMYDFMLFRMQF